MKCNLLAVLIRMREALPPSVSVAEVVRKMNLLVLLLPCCGVSVVFLLSYFYWVRN